MISPVWMTLTRMTDACTAVMVDRDSDYYDDRMAVLYVYRIVVLWRNQY